MIFQPQDLLLALTSTKQKEVYGVFPRYGVCWCSGTGAGVRRRAWLLKHWSVRRRWRGSAARARVC
ncbi:hypothetical protein V6Z11_A01G064300 [Gossypium hirsutum]